MEIVSRSVGARTDADLILDDQAKPKEDADWSSSNRAFCNFFHRGKTS